MNYGLDFDATNLILGNYYKLRDNSRLSYVGKKKFRHL